MIWWLVLAVALMFWGASTQGAYGFFAGVSISLMILPFWFVTWVFWFYDPEPYVYKTPNVCYTAEGDYCP